MGGQDLMKKKFFKRCAAFAASAVIAAGAAAYTGVSTIAVESGTVMSSTFDGGTQSWGTYKESGGDCVLSNEGGRLALKIANTGQKTYSVQMFYDIIPLYKNGVYRLKYDISCTTERYVEGMIQQNGGTYQAYTWKGLDISPTPQTVDYEFTMKADTDIMSKLVFNCGLQEKDGGALPQHTIYLDNVSLELVDGSRINKEDSEPYYPDISVNQVGYKPDSKKTAVFHNVEGQTQFSVINAESKETVYTGDLTDRKDYSYAGEVDWKGDFSSVTAPGKYYIKCDGLDDSYTFEISDGIYDKLITDTVKMLYLQRCGVEVVDDKFGHVACHNTLAKVYGTNDMIDVSGGWHDAGDYGRYVVPAAKAVADLLYSYGNDDRFFSDSTGIPESGNGVPDVLDEARFELEWMKKMQSSSGGVYHKVSCETFPSYDMPQNETDPLIVTPVSTTATADFAASMALAYEMYINIDKDFANDCLSRAERAWAFLEANPNLIFENPKDIVTGEYGDKSDRDERYWAAAQLYRATKSDKYLNALNNMAAYSGLDWALVGDYGNIALLTMDGINKNLDVYQTAYSTIKTQADNYKRNISASPYGIPVTKLEWGSNMTIANSGIILSLAYKLTGDSDYLDSANRLIDYLLGENPVGTCFVTGYGTVSPQTPHHRPSMAVKQAMPGMLVGGVNQNLEDSAAKAYCQDRPNAKRYVDNSESYSTNEITIYWNSPFTYLLTLTEDAEPVSEVKGDVNDDGKFDISDVVMFQKWLAKNGDITKLESADMDENGKCNVFDLVIMKKLLVK